MYVFQEALSMQSVEPMKRIDRRDDVVAPLQLALPPVIIQIVHNDLSRNAIASVHFAADRGKERVSIDAIDFRLWIFAPDGASHVAGSAAEIQNAYRLGPQEWKHRSDQLQVARFAGALLRPPQREQFVQVAADPRFDFGLTDWRRLHGSRSLCLASP